MTPEERGMTPGERVSITDLPSEITCHYLQQLGAMELLRTLSLSHRFRQATGDCIRHLTIPSGKMVDSQFLDFFPRLSRVDGAINIRPFKDGASGDEILDVIERGSQVSRKIRGDLTLHFQYPGQNEPTEQRIDLLQALLRLLRVRALLYPLHTVTLYLASPPGIEVYSQFRLGPSSGAQRPSDVTRIKVSTLALTDGRLTFHLLMGVRGGEDVRIRRGIEQEVRALGPLLTHQPDVQLRIYSFGQEEDLPPNPILRLLRS